MAHGTQTTNVNCKNPMHDNESHCCALSVRALRQDLRRTAWTEHDTHVTQTHIIPISRSNFHECIARTHQNKFGSKLHLIYEFPMSIHDFISLTRQVLFRIVCHFQGTIHESLSQCSSRRIALPPATHVTCTTGFQISDGVGVLVRMHKLFCSCCW